MANQESFDHVQDWLHEVDRYASPGTVKLLVGNKSDREDRVVSTEAGEAFASSLNLPFLETSAKTSENVEAAFLAMASELIKTKGTSKTSSGGNANATTKKIAVTVPAAGQKPNEQGCC